MKHFAILILTLILLCGCSDTYMLNLGIDDVYYVERMQKLQLESALTGDAYSWKVNGKEVATSRNYIFIAEKEGVYDISFDIIDEETPFHFAFVVNVLHEEVEYSPYISRVYEYCPAPGQFVNDMPKYEEGDTYADMLKKCEESISGTNDIMVSLGAWGGYITFGFDHTVMNVPGEYDFRILGNAFYELNDPGKKGGSAEAGIVMVSYDSNCNGLPDDEWYELAGSEYYKPTAQHNYSITYHRPDPERESVSDQSGMLTDLEYISWIDSNGEKGFIPKNSFHTQSYYPLWTDAEQLEFAGCRLPDNAVDTSGNGSYFVLYSFDWGYVDNHPNDCADLNSFDISHAVNKDGSAVELPGADFVRVYTGLNQYCGWIGETSTEISRAQDLHIQEINDI